MRSARYPLPFRSTYLSVINLLLSFGALAQSYQHQNFNELNGLPSTETYQAFQDSKGFVWIGTDNGVVRFDGGEMRLFSAAQGLTDNTVFGFFEDRRGNIWFRTFSGLISYYADSARKVVTYPFNNLIVDSLRANILNDVKVDSAGSLYFFPSMTGPSYVIDAAGKISLLEKARDTSFIYLHTIDAQRHEYAIGIVGIPRLLKGIKVGDRYFPATIDLNFHSSPVATYRYHNDALYVVVNRNVFRMRNDQLDLLYTSPEPIISFTIDKSGKFWVGMFGGGVQYFQDDSFVLATPIRQLANASVSGILQDHEGGFWFTTLDRGVFYFPHFEIEISHSEMGAESKRSCVGIGKNRAFIGRYNGEVTELLPGGKERLVYRDTTAIMAIHEDRNGGIWCASLTSVFLLAPDGAVRFKTVVSGIRGFYESGAGEVSGYSAAHTYTFSQQNGHRIDLAMKRRPAKIMTLGGETFVGTLIGLEHYDEKGRPLHADTFLLRTRIGALSHYNGYVLIGTIGRGLFAYKGNKLTSLTQGKVPVESVYALLTVKDQLWVATEGGIFVGNLKDLTRGEMNWKQLNRASGLLSDKCTHLAQIDDKVVAFSDRGLSWIPLNLQRFAGTKPVIYVQAVKINNEEMLSIPSRLKWDENNLLIDVGALAFNNRNLQFRQRLNNQPWNYSTDGTIAYYGLGSGTYRLAIEASLNAKDWVAYAQPLQFEILPPWWSTWIFRTGVFGLIVLIGLAVYRIRENAIRRKQSYLELINSHQQRLIDAEIQAQERERKRIAKDLHDGVGTALSSIKLLVGNALEDDPQARTQRVQEINDNLTEVIADIKRIVYDLHPPSLERYGLKVGLENLAEKINAHGVISVICDYYGQKEVSASVSIMIYRILQELINNTLKHARATEIRIHINQFDDEINVMYEDNGIGMVGSRFNGLGLHSIESRIRSLQGRMSWESNHKGTFYNFDVPYH